MIKLFADENATKVVESLDLGRIELGKTTKYKLYMKNMDAEWTINNLKIENLNPELEFDYPNMLQAGQVKEVYIYWTPKLDSRKPLNTNFKFSGEIYIG